MMRPGFLPDEYSVRLLDFVFSECIFMRKCSSHIFSLQLSSALFLAYRCRCRSAWRLANAGASRGATGRDLCDGKRGLVWTGIPGFLDLEVARAAFVYFPLIDPKLLHSLLMLGDIAPVPP